LRKPLLLGLLALGSTVIPAAPGDRDALRRIVQEQCSVHWAQQHSAAPCERIGADYAVLADRKGGAHFLLIPTRTLAGIESPAAFAADAPNYFEGAWEARDRIAAYLNAPLRRAAVGLASNPKRARSQDQLHIHVECLRSGVAAALHEAAGGITEHWSTLRIEGMAFDVRRVMGEDLGLNPIALLAAHLPGQDLGDYSLLVVGMDYAEGAGFALLSSGIVPGELLLDASCDANRTALR
jgi:CDP-diacylglycerol pyrophosphatase